MKKLLLYITALFTISSATNAQTILGSKDTVDVEIWNAGIKRMTAKKTSEVITHYKFAVQDANLTYAGTSGSISTAAAIQMNPAQKAGLVVTDNPLATISPSMLVAFNANHYAKYAISAYNYTPTTQWSGPADAASVYSENGAVGYFRNGVSSQYYKRQHSFSSYMKIGNRDGADINMEVEGFRSYGIFNNGTLITLKDFVAAEYANVNEDGKGNGTRYGLYMPFSKGKMTAAWGVYQSHSSVKNHFNGTMLIGSSTSNDLDKSQVTGGTKTDGLATGNRTVTGNHTAINTDHVILVNAASATVTLPDNSITPTIDTGKIFVIKKIYNDNASNITIDGGSADIDGASTYILLKQYSAVELQFDGSNYHVIGEVIR